MESSRVPIHILKTQKKRYCNFKFFWRQLERLANVIVREANIDILTENKMAAKVFLYGKRQSPKKYWDILQTIRLMINNDTNSENRRVFLELVENCA